MKRLHLCIVLAAAAIAAAGCIKFIGTRSPVATPTMSLTPSSALSYVRAGKTPSLLVLETRGVSAELVHNVGNPLLFDSDPIIRADAASALSVLARRCQESSHRGASHEPQMLDLLATALEQETSADVKRTIIDAVASFLYPEAAAILDKAASDADPSIREAAQEAKIKRNRKILRSISG